MPKVIDIAGRPVGAGHPVWIVAELGVTHEGDVALAHRMVDISADAGTDAVKVEVIDPDRLVADRTLEYSYDTAKDGTVTENYYSLLQRVALSSADLSKISEHARDRHIAFFGTAFDLPSVDFLRDIESCAIKISSGELTHRPLLEKAARSGLPVICDTGRALLSEVSDAEAILTEADATGIAFMHLAAGYPAPVDGTDLRIISSLQRMTQGPVGLSCHSIGMDAGLAAVALGASIIEKTITPDPTRRGDEHLMSLPFDDLAEYVRRIRWIERALGKDDRVLGPQEERDRLRFRQSVIAARPLAAGTTLTENDLDFARPAKGVPAGDAGQLVGHKLKHSVGTREFITWDDVEG